jgi:hypothetical protein
VSETASAEAVFGSASRGDGDELSDRDILIVDADTRVLARRQIELEGAGWSVASYTYKKLRALVKRRALFVQHLKMESRVLKDVYGELGAILKEFQPKRSYHTEIAENASLAHMVSVWPKTARGAMWAADVLYVAARNFGILYLASQGEYTFSYSRVLESLCNAGILRGSAIPELMKLRIIKTHYRYGSHIAREQSEETLRRALVALPPLVFPMRSIGIDPESALSAAMQLPKGIPAYHRVRNLERSYIALLGACDSNDVAEKYRAVVRWIENPRAYGSYAETYEGELIDSMRRAVVRSRAMTCKETKVLALHQ